jgi:serine/threonine protein kinase
VVVVVSCGRAGRLGLPPFAVRHFAHQLLTGLAELHDVHQVVHRDLKPSNCLLQQPYVVRKDEVSDVVI